MNEMHTLVKDILNFITTLTAIALPETPAGGSCCAITACLKKISSFNHIIYIQYIIFYLAQASPLTGSSNTRHHAYFFYQITTIFHRYLPNLYYVFLVNTLK